MLIKKAAAQANMALGRLDSRSGEAVVGQEFAGYAACLRAGVADVEHASERPREINLGATAVRTGLNTGSDHASLAADTSVASAVWR